MTFSFIDTMRRLINESGFTSMSWQQLVMLAVSCVLIYLAIVKKFEPLLLLPIAFGVLLANLPLAGMMMEPTDTANGGLLYYLYLGVKKGIYPSLIFLGIGAMTDFGPLIARPSSLFLGAAAQLGIYVAFITAVLLGFSPEAAASIGIIGGADGPTAILVASILQPKIVRPYSHCSIFLYGFDSSYTATYNEGINYEKGKRNKNGGSKRGIKEGENYFPDSCYNSYLPTSSFSNSFNRFAHVG